MPTVLIVDDALFMRAAISNTLKKCGFDVVGEAANGKEAIALYEALQPDLVTMDITMPGMTGIEAVKAIIGSDPDAVIIMITALGHQNKIKAALQAGAKDFITKPFQPEQLQTAALTVLDLH